LENFKIKEPSVFGFLGHFQNQRTCGSGFIETIRIKYICILGFSENFQGFPQKTSGSV
jgi:hypothetical protein